MEFAYMVVKLILALGFLLGIMIITLKYTGRSINSNLNKKYIRVIDRVQISKDTFIAVIRMGNKGVVLLTSLGHTEKLEDLSEEEIKMIEQEKKESLDNMTQIFDKFIDKIKSKEEINE